MNDEDLFSTSPMTEPRRAIEAIVLVSSDPVPVQLLAQIIELSVDTADQLCRELALSYDIDNRGFQLVEVAGGWRFQTHPDLAPYVERFAMSGQSTRLSTAALETLSIVAYKQPVSRAQVSAIRGVNVDAVLRTLVQRGYVEEVGRDLGAGQAVLFGTTQYFLERLGLNAVSDLPALGDFVPSADVVEALEQTLRVDPDSPPPETTTDEEGTAGAAASEGTVVDEEEGAVEEGAEGEGAVEEGAEGEGAVEEGAEGEGAVEGSDSDGAEPDPVEVESSDHEVEAEPESAESEPEAAVEHDSAGDFEITADAESGIAADQAGDGAEAAPVEVGDAVSPAPVESAEPVNDGDDSHGSEGSADTPAGVSDDDPGEADDEADVAPEPGKAEPPEPVGDH